MQLESDMQRSWKEHNRPCRGPPDSQTPS